MRNFHVVLKDGTERNVRADNFEIREGQLSFLRADGPVLVYNVNEWQMVEVESQDDRGE
jgi:hypothetical protein